MHSKIDGLIDMMVLYAYNLLRCTLFDSTRQVYNYGHIVYKIIC